MMTQSHCTFRAKGALSIVLSVHAATAVDSSVKTDEWPLKTNWHNQCADDIPAALNALEERLIINSNDSASILCAHFHAVDRQSDRVASIAAVLKRRHPTAIIRRIRAIVIYAVKLEIIAESVRQTPVYEALRIVQPLVADEDAATAVSTETFIQLIITAVLYVLKTFL